MQRLFADRSFEQGRLARYSRLVVLVLLAGISAYGVISMALERGHSDDLALGEHPKPAIHDHLKTGQR